jgi:hypothetical protein
MAVPKTHYKRQLKIGVSLIGLFVLLTLMKKDSILSPTILTNPWFSFTTSLFIIIGCILLIPFEWIPDLFFDNRDYEPNVALPELIQKIRFRAILFNNIAILIFVITVGVIISGLYFLLTTDASTNNANSFTNTLILKLASITLLIFLIGVLFRAFKYLLRVAAFYNGRADGLEITLINKNADPKDMMTTLSPDSFDISDLPESSVLQSLGSFVKGKP